jgi:hypothetical protein
MAIIITIYLETGFQNNQARKLRAINCLTVCLPMQMLEGFHVNDLGCVIPVISILLSALLLDAGERTKSLYHRI